MNRRDLLRLGARALLVIPGMALLWPALSYIANPVLGGRRLTGTVSIGPLDGLGREPTRREVGVTLRDAWEEEEKIFLIWARLGDDGKPEVLSATCPHQRCPVNWVAEENLYVCPCHQSRFRIDGLWVSGPSEGPLKRLSTEQADGDLLVSIENLTTL